MSSRIQTLASTPSPRRMIDRNAKLTTGFEVTLLTEERQLDIINEEKE
jgi:hypothetical protein